MASHYIALNRGQEGLTTTDFVLGAVSAGNAGLEVRLDDASGYRKIDFVRQLRQIARYMENAQNASVSGFVLTE